MQGRAYVRALKIRTYAARMQHVCSNMSYFFQDWVQSFMYRGEVDRDFCDALAEQYILTTCSCKVWMYTVETACSAGCELPRTCGAGRRIGSDNHIFFSLRFPDIRMQLCAIHPAVCIFYISDARLIF